MSGESVTLAGDSDGRLARLVAAAGIVARDAGVPVALIGGLAVVCRVPRSLQRATQDLDFVSDEPDPPPPMAEFVGPAGLAGSNLARAHPGSLDDSATHTKLLIEGTIIEIIETYALKDEAVADVDEPIDQLALLAHRWALDTATKIDLTVDDGSAAATLRVATPAAIVAMKLHSIEDRKEVRKRASDAWDLFHLLDAHNRDGAVSREIASAGPRLAALTRDALARVFLERSTVTRRWVAVYGAPEWTAIMSEEKLADLALAFDRFLV